MSNARDVWQGTWVLITGASSGLGEEFARQLAPRRANLLLTARSGERLSALAAELQGAHGISVEVIPLDLAQPGGAERLLAEVARRREVDHLISNAGFGCYGPFAESDPSRLGEMVRLNCEALTILSARLLPRLLSRGAGGLLHVASVAGFQTTPHMATYGATKAFVLSLSEAISEELRGSGVRCMALCPGPVPTGFQRAAGGGISSSQRRAVLSAAEVVREGLAAYEAGRVLCVPGAVNRAGAIGVRLLPRTLVARLVGRMMSKKRVRGGEPG